MTNKKLKVGNVPNLRFPEFQGEWETKRFGELIDFKTTNSFSRDNLNYETGTVKNIHYGDIHTKFQTLFDVENENIPFINEEININRISEDNYCKEGDIIFADASEDLNDIGKSIEITNLNNEKVLSGLHTLLARPKQNIFQKGYLGYSLKSNNVRYQIQKESQGSKVLSINAGRLSKIKVSFPRLEEQRKIADYLFLLDSRINTQNKIIEQLGTLIKSVSQKLFTQKVRFKEFSNSWTSRKLREISTIYDGTHQTPNYVESGVPFYSVEQVTANDFSQTKFISEEVFEKENQRVTIKKGDILMTRIGDIGTVRYINWDVKASFYVSLALIKTSEEISSEYLSHYICSNSFQKELWDRTIHVAFPKKN